MGLLVLPVAVRADGGTQFVVPLRFEKSYVVPDAAKATFRNPTPAAEANRERFLKVIAENLRKLGPAFRWNEGINAQGWCAEDVEPFDAPWEEGTERLQRWYDQGPGRSEGQWNWNYDVLGPVLANDLEESGPLAGLRQRTPLSLHVPEDFETAYWISFSGEVVLDVSAPIGGDEAGALVMTGNDSAQPLVPDLQDNLKSWTGRLWWSDDIEAAARDYLRLRAIETTDDFSLTGYFIQANAKERKVWMYGPTRVSVIGVATAHQAEANLHLVTGAYNLLPTPLYRALRRTSGEKYGVDPQLQMGKKDIYVVTLGTKEMVSYPLGLEASARSAERLATLGYTQAVSGDSSGLTVLFVAPEPKKDETKKDAAERKAAESPAVKKNSLVFRAGAGTGKKYAASAEYRRTQIDGSDDLALAFGFEEELPEGKAAYTWDYVGFPALDRRLTLGVQAGRDAAVDRQVVEEAATEKKDEATGTAGFEVWRNFRDHWLTVDLEAGVSRSRLQNKEDDAPGFDTRYEATTTRLHGAYSHSGDAGGLPWMDIEGEIGAGWGRDAGTADYQWTRWSLVYRRLVFDALRWEVRGRVHYASSGTPLAELPSFGGEDSVRGFRRDTAYGQGGWSVQNELWFRSPASLPFVSKEIAGVLRRSLAWALFVDVGGVSEPVDRTVSFASGAGIGLRFSQGPMTLRADWAHSLSHDGNVKSGSAGYLTVQIRPAL